MDYHDIAMSIADTMKKAGAELSDDQRILLVGAISPFLEAASNRAMLNSRISYMGFSYGMGAQWGIDSLQRAINRNKHD